MCQIFFLFRSDGKRQPLALPQFHISSALRHGLWVRHAQLHLDLSTVAEKQMQQSRAINGMPRPFLEKPDVGVHCESTTELAGSQ